MSAPETIRDAALATDGVLAMHAGPHGTASTYSPSGRIWGVRTGTGRVDVHIVADQSYDLVRLGRAVQRAVRDVAGDYAGEVMVHVEDIAAPAGDADSASSGSGATSVDGQGRPRRSI